VCWLFSLRTTAGVLNSQCTAELATQAHASSAGLLRLKEAHSAYREEESQNMLAPSALALGAVELFGV
jgi:hypothetical protein